MTRADPQRLLRAIRRVTVGSLVAAAVGAGVATVHLADSHAAAAAAAAAPRTARPTDPPTSSTPAPSTPAPSARSATSPTRSRAVTGGARPRVAPRPAKKTTTTFHSVAPVAPSRQQPQAKSTGS